MSDAKRKTLIKLLNAQFAEFVRAIAAVATSAEFAVFPVLVDAAIAADDGMVAAQMEAHMTDEYLARIDARDDAFFRSPEFEAEKAGELGGLDLFAKLRGEWDGMSAENRETVWGWLANLAKIVRKIRALA